MAEPSGVDARLSGEEWSLVSALREVPDSPLRSRVVIFIGALLRFVAEPRCAEMQGDGVPCSTADAHCDECMHVSTLIDELERRSMVR